MRTTVTFGTAVFAAWIAGAVLVLTAPTACEAAAARWRPDRNVEIVVSTSPGTGSDATARLIQRLLLEKKLIDAVAMVVNKAGGGGTIGLTYLAQHPGNGHYFMVTSPSMQLYHSGAVLRASPIRTTGRRPTQPQC
jgi:tripartite-type tricarboxylate transporter receptor subunit TctC